MIKLFQYVYNNYWSTAANGETQNDAYKRVLEEINKLFDKEKLDGQHIEESYMPDAEFFRYEGTN